MSDSKSSGRTTEAASDSVLTREEIHEEWDSDYLAPEMDRCYERAYDNLVELLRPPPDAPLLDAGCGYCHHAVRLAERGFKVSGIDMSEPALAAARQYLAKKGMTDRISLQQGNLLDLPFEDGQWDYVHCWGVLMHVPDLEGALSELARVTKPGGTLILMENNMRSVHTRVFEPLIRSIKTIIGRYNPSQERTERGIERWYNKPGGTMLVRMTDMDFLTRFLRDEGLTLRHRLASQLSELYTSVPIESLKHALQVANTMYVDRKGAAGIAQGNILVFEKTG